MHRVLPGTYVVPPVKVSPPPPPAMNRSVVFEMVLRYMKLAPPPPASTFLDVGPVAAVFVCNTMLTSAADRPGLWQSKVLTPARDF